GVSFRGLCRPRSGPGRLATAAWMLASATLAMSPLSSEAKPEIPKMTRRFAEEGDMQIRSHLLVMVALLFCVPPPLAVADDAADRQAIESAAQRWIKALNAQDAASLGALTTEDVMVLSGSSHRIAGSKNARDVWLRVAAVAVDTR